MKKIITSLFIVAVLSFFIAPTRTEAISRIIPKTYYVQKNKKVKIPFANTKPSKIKWSVPRGIYSKISKKGVFVTKKTGFFNVKVKKGKKIQKMLVYSLNTSIGCNVGVYSFYSNSITLSVDNATSKTVYAPSEFESRSDFGESITFVINDSNSILPHCSRNITYYPKIIPSLRGVNENSIIINSSHFSITSKNESYSVVCKEEFDNDYSSSEYCYVNGRRVVYCGYDEEDDINNMSYKEYKKIKIGMTLGQVKKIVGCVGLRTYTYEQRGTKIVTYSWNEEDYGEDEYCITFKNGKVTSKYF